MLQRSRMRVGPMTKSLTAIVALALAAVSCSRGVSRVQTRSLPAPNPTSYSFPFPLTEVRTKALEVFSIDHQVEQSVFGRPTGAVQLQYVFFVECATNAVFGEAVFRNPSNSDDLYLHTLHDPFVIS